VGIKHILTSHAGDGFPASAMTDIDGLFKPGLTANILKIYHFIRLLWWAVPFKINNPEPRCRAKVTTFFDALRTHEAANAPVGAAGFCWGGQWVVELCADRVKAANGKSLVDVGYTAHPSRVKVPDDIEKVVKPLSVAACEHDRQLPKPAAEQTRDILEGKTAKGKGVGVAHEFVWYEGAHHGFAVRASEEDKKQAAKGEMAAKQAIEWFKRWFAAYE